MSFLVTRYYVPDRVIGLNSQRHVIQLQSGRQIPYARLLLANGARPRSLTCPGNELSGVTTLRSIADYRTVVAHLPAIRHVVVVGGSTLALETVESLRQRGHEVTQMIRSSVL